MKQIQSQIRVGQYVISLAEYSDGSIDVKLSADVLAYLSQTPTPAIYASLKCPGGLLAYRYLLDHIESYFASARCVVALTYIPSSRQDRLNGDKGVLNVFTLRSVGKLLESSVVDRYLLTDPHSDVSPALINKSTVMDQAEVFKRLQDRFDFECDVIVAPDAGAFKKSDMISQKIHRPLVLASKHRDPISNQLTDTKILAGDIRGKHVAIVDDILDGGRTFIALAKVLKEQGASKVSLFVTHGLFSYGTECLVGDIDEVFVYYNWLKSGDYDADFIRTYLNV